MLSGWEAGIRTPITWSRERCTDSVALPSVRFLSGFHLACFRLLRSVSVRSRAECLFVSHLSVEAVLRDNLRFAAEPCRKPIHVPLNVQSIRNLSSVDSGLPENSPRRSLLE